MDKYLIIAETLQNIGYFPFHIQHSKGNIYEYNQLIMYMYKNFVQNNTFSYIPKTKTLNSPDLIVFKNNDFEYLQFKYKLNKHFSLDKIKVLYERYITNAHTNKLVLSTYNHSVFELQNGIIAKYNNDNIIYQDCLNEANKIVNNIDDFKKYMLEHKKMWESTEYQNNFIKIEEIIITKWKNP